MKISPPKKRKHGVLITHILIGAGGGLGANTARAVGLVELLHAHTLHENRDGSGLSGQSLGGGGEGLSRYRISITPS